jgi:hypothetical protein
MASGDAPSPKTAATSQHRISTVVVTFFFFSFFFPLSFVIHHQHLFTSTRIFFSFFFFFFCFAEILVCPLVQYLKRLVDSHSLASARMFIRNDNDNNNVIRVYSFSFLRRRR